MPKWLSIRRLAVVALSIGLAAGMWGCQTRYPASYVYRVLVLQGSDFADIHRFPSRAIAPSDAPLDIPLALDADVAKVLEQHPDIDDLDEFLAQADTTAFLVIHDGRLVLERYYHDHDQTTFQNTFSVSKSVMSALVGLALGLDQPITQHLPELTDRDPRFAEITVKDLLNMRSGIEYSSETPFPFINADDALIYYHPDLESVVLERTEIASPPGEFQYNNYNPPLLGLILCRTTGLPPAEYLERNLWQPLGATYGAGWTVDDHGIERMESGFHARARDLARFGLLYLNRGEIAGRRILSEDWIATSTELPEHPELEQYDGRTWGYRLGWWIVPRPEQPSDFCAIGRYGQYIYISPQHNVVFVRNGPGPGDWNDYDWTEFFYAAAQRF